MKIYGKWIYTDKTTMKVSGLQPKNMVWPNGYIYKGEFKNSEWSGVGTLFFPDGSTYEEWAKFMNKGTFTWSDGKQKTGIWKNGITKSNFKELTNQIFGY